MNKEDLQLLNDAARCIDDCLIIIYPEEFDDWAIVEAKKRFVNCRGIISRTATMADALRQLAEKSKRK